MPKQGCNIQRCPLGHQMIMNKSNCKKGKCHRCRNVFKNGIRTNMVCTECVATDNKPYSCAVAYCQGCWPKRNSRFHVVAKYRVEEDDVWKPEGCSLCEKKIVCTGKHAEEFYKCKNCFYSVCQRCCKKKSVKNKKLPEKHLRKFAIVKHVKGSAASSKDLAHARSLLCTPVPTPDPSVGGRSPRGTVSSARSGRRGRPRASTLDIPQDDLPRRSAGCRSRRSLFKKKRNKRKKSKQFNEEEFSRNSYLDINELRAQHGITPHSSDLEVPKGRKVRRKSTGRRRSRSSRHGRRSMGTRSHRTPRRSRRSRNERKSSTQVRKSRPKILKQRSMSDPVRPSSDEMSKFSSEAPSTAPKSVDRMLHEENQTRGKIKRRTRKRRSLGELTSKRSAAPTMRRTSSILQAGNQIHKQVYGDNAPAEIKNDDGDIESVAEWMP